MYKRMLTELWSPTKIFSSRYLAYMYQVTKQCQVYHSGGISNEYKRYRIHNINKQHKNVLSSTQCQPWQWAVRLHLRLTSRAMPHINNQQQLAVMFHYIYKNMTLWGNILAYGRTVYSWQHLQVQYRPVCSLQDWSDHGTLFFITSTSKLLFSIFCLLAELSKTYYYFHNNRWKGTWDTEETTRFHGQADLKINERIWPWLRYVLSECFILVTLWEGDDAEPLKWARHF